MTAHVEAAKFMLRTVGVEGVLDTVAVALVALSIACGPDGVDEIADSLRRWVDEERDLLQAAHDAWTRRRSAGLN